jgi:mannose-6-phosphate isomerase-like protein (cupin superfamily)
MQVPATRAFDLAALMAHRERAGLPYFEFLKVPSLSMGIYYLAAGRPDPQEPHPRDEVYYVLNGRAILHMGNHEQPVETGSIAFVRAGVEHRFHTIVEDLTLLVFFAAAVS